MRKLGEQWVEEIDGQEHMVKAVEKNGKCTGCIHLFQQDRCHVVCRHHSAWTSVECEYKVIDLGILNEDGCLPCPFCGEYPIINSDYNDENKKCFDIICTNEECGCYCETLFYSIKQEAIDAWNRRTR